MRVARVSETQSLGISTVEEGLLGTVEALPENKHPESSPDRAREIPKTCFSVLPLLPSCWEQHSDYLWKSEMVYVLPGVGGGGPT